MSIRFCTNLHFFCALFSLESYLIFSGFITLTLKLLALIAPHSAEDIEVLCDTVSEMDKSILTKINITKSPIGLAFR